MIATNTSVEDEVLSRHTSAGSVFYAFDPSGNTVQRLNSSGTALSTSTYDAFGFVNTNDTSGDPYGGFGAQYGYYLDTEKGLYLLGARYYDASAGRFLNRDPAMDGANWYSYCGNNPLTNSDPSGLWSWQCIACRAAAGAIIAAGGLALAAAIALLASCFYMGPLAVLGCIQTALAAISAASGIIAVGWIMWDHCPCTDDPPNPSDGCGGGRGTGGTGGGGGRGGGRGGDGGRGGGGGGGKKIFPGCSDIDNPLPPGWTRHHNAVGSCDDRPGSVPVTGGSGGSGIGDPGHCKKKQIAH